MAIVQAAIVSSTARSIPIPRIDARPSNDWAGVDWYNNPTIYNDRKYVSFDGIDQYATSLGLAADQDYSLEFYIRTGGDNGVIVSDSNLSGYHQSLFEIVSGDLTVGYYTGVGGPVLQTSNPVIEDFWQHYVCTYVNGGALKLYINGILESDNTGYTGTAKLGAAGALAFFREDFTDLGDSTYLAVDFREFRLYDQALTDYQVLQQYNSTRSRYQIIVTPEFREAIPDAGPGSVLGYIPGNVIVTCNEGDVVWLNTVWQNLPYQTTANLLIDGTGITAGDVSILGATVGNEVSLGQITSSESLDSYGAGISGPIEILADHTTEGAESLTYHIKIPARNRDYVANLTIVDTSLNPTYTLATAGSVSSIDEGAELTFNVTTTDVVDGTTLYWFVGSTGSYALSAGRFSPGTGGSFTVNSGAGTFTVTISADSFTATGTQSYNIFLSTTSPSPTSVGNTLSITVNDTSQSPTYEVTAVGDVASVNEGSVLTFDVTTTNVPNGTTLYWTIGHVNTNSADFSATSGTVTINSNTGSFTVTALADTTTEGAETFVVRIRTVSTSGTIVATSSTKTINDTSLSPPVNGSAVFNQPQTDYVSLPALPDWNLGTTWTVEFWLYMNSSSIGGNQQGGIWALLNQKGWATTDSINIALSGGYLQINQGNNTSYYNKYIIEPAPLQWVHVAIVNNAGTNKVYYNGIEQVPPGGIGSQDYTASWTNSTNPLYIGSLGDYAGGSGPGGSTFDGKITNLRITDRAEYLTNFNPPTVLPTKITNHTRLLWTPTDQALATDTSDDPHTITNNGVTYSSSYPATNNTRGSAVFNGSTNRFYKIPGGSHLQLGTTWTIEWWQKSTAVTAGNGNLYTIMSQAPDGGRIDIYYQGGNLVVQNGQTLCAEPAIDVWVHVAMVNNAGVGTVYYDGVAQGATGNFGNYGQTQDLYIGKRGNNTFQYFNGKLTNIRITDTAVYASTFVPDQLPTVVASHTKLLLRPTVDTIYGVDEGNLGLAVSSSGATYSSDYAPVTNTYTAMTWNENDGYAGGYSTNAINVKISDYPGIVNVPNGATVVLTGQTSGTFTVGSGHPFSQAITEGGLRKLIRGLGIAIYGGDTLTFTWRT